MTYIDFVHLIAILLFFNTGAVLGLVLGIIYERSTNKK